MHRCCSQGALTAAEGKSSHVLLCQNTHVMLFFVLSEHAWRCMLLNGQKAACQFWHLHVHIGLPLLSIIASRSSSGDH